MGCNLFIQNENGDVFYLFEFMQMVAVKKEEPNNGVDDIPNGGNWKDDEGYIFSNQEFS